jgi:hypothetical protein
MTQGAGLSVGLQGSCILILDPDRFDLTVGGRRRLFSYTRTTLQLFLDIITYSRLLFSCRLPFRSTTDYLTHGNTLIYLYLDLQSESNHLFLHLVFDPICATDRGVLFLVTAGTSAAYFGNRSMFTMGIFTKLASDPYYNKDWRPRRPVEKICYFTDLIHSMFSVETTSADISSLRDINDHIVKKQCRLLRTEKNTRRCIRDSRKYTFI